MPFFEPHGFELLFPMLAGFTFFRFWICRNCVTWARSCGCGWKAALKGNKSICRNMKTQQQFKKLPVLSLSSLDLWIQDISALFFNSITPSQSDTKTFISLVCFLLPWVVTCHFLYLEGIFIYTFPLTWLPEYSICPSTSIRLASPEIRRPPDSQSRARWWVFGDYSLKNLLCGRIILTVTRHATPQHALEKMLFGKFIFTSLQLHSYSIQFDIFTSIFFILHSCWENTDIFEFMFFAVILPKSQSLNS